MSITNHCFWEHNADDTLLWSVTFPGAYARGKNLDEAIEKMPDDIKSRCEWLKEEYVPTETVVSEEKASSLDIRDADSDCIFKSESQPLSMEEYIYLRDLALASAKNFLSLYDSVPDKNVSALSERKTFYGSVPVTAEQMYQHTKNVNSYYFSEIGVEADNDGNIYECRLRGFRALESMPDFLENKLYQGSFDEMWSLRKVLRRFIWHDRIHAKAMKRMIYVTFG